MASQSFVEQRHGLSVGSVFGRSVNVIKANPLATLGVTYVLIALPQLLIGQVSGWALPNRSLTGGGYAAFGLYGLVVAILWLVASGALVQATVAHDQGRSADLREMLQVGAQRALPLFAVYLLFVLGVWIGSIFLLVPGILLAVMWAVCLPAVVAERTGVFGAFGRSRALTKGARWPVFGIMLLAFVIYMLVLIAVGLASVAGYGTFGAFTRGGHISAPMPPSLAVALLRSIVTTVVLTWFTIVGASLFIELRNWKDGPDADRLADIFA
ncbi:hypothetical protein [Sphingomonas sp. GC_Shp_3]|uniref:hypothetical protein n=1 Tax=Sphingomonas sp. GC_Shp_3 TaxID=2937383 RepID=UPI00226AECB3|nr:hypothetical protein [Sphingomonas sp. GC_Shp_3]